MSTGLGIALGIGIGFPLGVVASRILLWRARRRFERLVEHAVRATEEAAKARESAILAGAHLKAQMVCQGAADELAQGAEMEPELRAVLDSIVMGEPPGAGAPEEQDPEPKAKDPSGE